MKVVICAEGIFSLAKPVVQHLFQTHPELFGEPMPAAEMCPEGCTPEECYPRAVLHDGQLYFLKESSPALRALPWFVAQAEKDPESLQGEYRCIFKVLDIPDEVKWYIREESDGSEVIHEEHRTWY